MYNKFGQIIKHDSYYTNNKNIHWETGDTIIYYKFVNLDQDTKPPFEGHKNAWIQKHIWLEGRDSLTQEFKQSYRE